MRHRIYLSAVTRGWAAVLTGAALLAAQAARADTLYKMHSIIKLGDTVGGLKIISGISLSTLNDRGQLAFVAVSSPGGQALFSVADGQITPLVTAGGDGPDGPWPKAPSFNPLTSINQGGDIAFSLDTRGVYLWTAATRQFTAVATVGMPAPDGLTFTTGNLNSPSLNNRAEVTVGMAVKDAAGKTRTGLYLRTAEGKLVPLPAPGQALPDGSPISRVSGAPTLNDAAATVFYAMRPGDTQYSGYLWEQGSLTPVAVWGTALPGGATITHLSGFRVNNRNRDVLVALEQDGTHAAGLYWNRNGQFTPIVLPGQDLPGGDKLKTVRQFTSTDVGATAGRHISRANELGQYAFVAQLEDGNVGVYLLDVDGKLSLVLKTGMTTDQGIVTHINPVVDRPAVGLNSQGQVALTVKIANGPETLVVLTPVAP